MADSQSLEKSPVSIWPITWKYAFIIGICLFIYSLILYLTGLAAVSGLSLLGYVIFIVLLVFTLKSYKKSNNNYMVFGQGVLIGIVVSIVASVISSTLNALYLAFVDKTFLSTILDKTRMALQDAGVSGDQMDTMMRIYENFLFTPVGIFVMGIVSGVIGGFIFSLILAAVMKNPPPISD